MYKAYSIRLHSVEEYGNIIHEFDPYFNFRATEYLYHNGWARFVTWFDYQSWYPLGRPVGTTIYPGMQVTAVFIKNHIMKSMSLNDICVYIPAWFGAIASLFTGLLAYECSLPMPVPMPASPMLHKDATKTKQYQPKYYGSILEHIPILNILYTKIVIPILTLFIKAITILFGTDLGLATNTIIPISNTYQTPHLSSPAVESGLITAMLMAIVPAHMMRSVAGGYDNESIANTAMVMTFYLWCRSLRGGVDYKSGQTLFWAILTGFSYFYMVAVWGGYVFVINLIGIHAAVLVGLGRFGPKLYRAYSIFYFIGTTLAIQVPVVGWTPLKSLEQLGPAGVFVAFQLLAFCDYYKVKKKLNVVQTWKLRVVVFAIAALVVFGLAGILDRHFGFFGPISARVRGLFVKHTKTGNPLVDSVAEHQPASSSAYTQYLGDSIVTITPIGFLLVALRYFHDPSSFLLVYAMATYFFSHKMVRLILLTAPIASVLTGIALGRLFSFFMYNVLGFTPCLFDLFSPEESGTSSDGGSGSGTSSSSSSSSSKDGKKKSKKNGNSTSNTATTKSKKNDDKKNTYKYLNLIRIIACKIAAAIGFYILLTKECIPKAMQFYEHASQVAVQMSHPTIIMKGKTKNGDVVEIDDYRECYWWLRDNTPEDARIMAWWDYGYQITAIANRTTIADGNTWNHEHIALLGRALTSPEKEGHRIARHLADYVLVWAGGGGDDLAKSPHLARIANSVYRDMCPGDPTCSQFGWSQHRGPSKMMQASLLFKLHSHNIQPGVTADPNRFREKFKSRYGKCRIFKVMSVSQESKDWVADPKNKLCDAPGSWYCPGQYPPGMKKILAEKRDFSQLEDFNKDEDDSEYQKKYFENLGKRNKGPSEPKPNDGSKKKSWKPSRVVSPEEIKHINHMSMWKDTEQTSAMWELISQNRVRELMEVIAAHPELAHMRSSDGRGPMFWAMEHGNDKVARVLRKVGVSDQLKDANGMAPHDLKRDKEL